LQLALFSAWQTMPTLLFRGTISPADPSYVE